MKYIETAKLREDLLSKIQHNYELAEVESALDSYINSVLQNQEKRFVRADMNGKHIFEGDKIQYQLRGGMYLNTGVVVYDSEMCAFVVDTENDIKRYLPLLSECSVFSLVS